MSRRWPPVIMYHAVSGVPDDPNAVCVAPEQLEAQMAYLKRRGLRGVCMRELVQAMRSGAERGLVGLTFDDGYEDFLHSAVPVLESFGFSGTVFALSGMLGGENIWDEGPRLRLLDAEGLCEVIERGMEVGAHGSSHVRLSGLKEGLLRREIVESRQTLSDALGEDIRGFCYPYGDLDAVAAEMVRRAGYDYACAYKIRLRHDIYDIPRVHVGNKDGALRLALKLRGLTRSVDLLRSVR